MTADATGSDLQAEIAALRARVAELEQATADERLKSRAFESLASHLPNGWVLMFDHDLRHTFIDGGPTYEDASETIEGKTLSEFFPPETSAALGPIYQAALAGESTSFSIPFDGSTYDFYVMPIRDGDENVLAGMAIATDTTSLSDLRNQLKTFEMIVENAADGVIRYGLDGTIHYLNAAAVKLFGLTSAEDFLGKRVEDHSAESELESHFDEISEAVLQQGVWRGKYLNKRLNGELFLTQSSLFMLMDQQGNPSGSAVIFRDVSGEEQERQEKLELQQQVIDAQQATLRELSTPLIPLSEGVVALPLVGTIDSNRALQIMETLLEGIATQQAEVALLDITGVRIIDTQVADALLRAAQAAKLLGAQVVLTGISAEIAQTLVQLGADMSSITTRATLQSGIAYALEQQVAY